MTPNSQITTKRKKLDLKWPIYQWSRGPGAHGYEHATPILSLSHGIFTDWSIFRIHLLLRKKGSSDPATPRHQLVLLRSNKTKNNPSDSNRSRTCDHRLPSSGDPPLNYRILGGYRPLNLHLLVTIGLHTTWTEMSKLRHSTNEDGEFWAR